MPMTVWSSPNRATSLLFELADHFALLLPDFA
jgi:hypothetical protein